jgi:hypothetical protein
MSIKVLEEKEGHIDWTFEMSILKAPLYTHQKFLLIFHRSDPRFLQKIMAGKILSMGI